MEEDEAMEREMEEEEEDLELASSRRENSVESVLSESALVSLFLLPLFLGGTNNQESVNHGWSCGSPTVLQHRYG